MISTAIKQEVINSMKIIIIAFLLIFSLSAQAQTVHKWEAELSDMCSMYVSTKYTPRELYTCLIVNTQDYFIWRHGWEQPVEKKVLGILTQYDTSVLNLSNREKAVIADKYRRTLPGMYEYKMGKRKNLDKNFTEEDVNRIWNADLYLKEGR